MTDWFITTNRWILHCSKWKLQNMIVFTTKRFADRRKVWSLFMNKLCNFFQENCEVRAALLCRSVFPNYTSRLILRLLGRHPGQKNCKEHNGKYNVMILTTMNACFSRTFLVESCYWMAAKMWGNIHSYLYRCAVLFTLFIISEGLPMRYVKLFSSTNCTCVKAECLPLTEYCWYSYSNSIIGVALTLVAFASVGY